MMHFSMKTYKYDARMKKCPQILFFTIINFLYSFASNNVHINLQFSFLIDKEVFLPIWNIFRIEKHSKSVKVVTYNENGNNILNIIG